MDALYGFTGPIDNKIASNMQHSLQHRGQQTKQIQLGHITLGYLAQTSGHGGVLENPPLSIALAGQIWNAQHLQKSLATSYNNTLDLCLKLYQQQGPSFVKELRGNFVLAISQPGYLYLARDGAGARSLYYALYQNRLLFASEPKALWQLAGFPRQIHPPALAQYLAFSFIPGPGTMLKDIYELMPGHWLEHSPGQPVTTHRYFCFEDQSFAQNCAELPDDSSHWSSNEWLTHFRSLFSQSITERIPPNQPLGAFLSGGIDSSVVVAEVARQLPHKLKTYAVHFGKNYPNELEYAREVAKMCQTDHQEILIRPQDFLPRLRQIIWHLDDPIGDPVTMPNFELAQHAATEVSWVFNGEGGDPCFGGPKNIPMLLQHWYGGDQPPNFREKAYLASYRRAYEEIPRLLTPEWLAQVDFQRDLEAILTPFFQNAPPTRFLDKLTSINIRLKGGHLILPKIERMQMAAGITPLSPLFDERLIALSFLLPGSLKLHQGVEKVILKQAFARELPPEVIQRPKSGMRVPVHFWFQGELKRYAKKILSRSSLKQAGIFNPDRVKQLLRYDIQEGQGRYGIRLWMLVTFEIWRRIVVEGEKV